MIRLYSIRHGIATIIAVTWDIAPQDVITRDNVSLKVNAGVYFRVTSATKAVIEVENFRYAVEQAAETSLRSVLGDWNWTICWRSGRDSTSVSKRSSTNTQRHGA